MGDYFKCAFPAYGFNDLSALVPKILRTTFNGVKSSADIALGEQVRQAIISMPDHVDDDMRENIERAARLAGYSLTTGNLEAISLKYTDAVRSTYNLDVPDTQERLSVLVDYNEGSLELWILNGRVNGKAKGHVIFPELGVQAIEDETADAYFLTIQRRVETSLRKHLVDKEGKIMPLRAVVLAGDASEKGMQGMKSALVEALGNLKYEGALGLVKDSVDTLYVAAVGAAMKGRDVVQHPERFEGKQNAGHGEL